MVYQPALELLCGSDRDRLEREIRRLVLHELAHHLNDEQEVPDWRQSEGCGHVACDFPAGRKDDLGTEKLFKSMIGRVYTVQGFDKYGNVELEPKRLNTVWVDPELLKLRTRKSKKRKHK